jgi:hypothetical protein
MFTDLHKTMDSGIFLNINELWDNDEDFAHREQLNHTVMDAGVYKGGRYIIPLTYQLNMLMGEKGMLDSVGFDIDKNTDMLSFYNMLAQTVPLARENPLFSAPVFHIDSDYRNLQMYSGISLADHERGAALPDEAAVRAAAEAFKLFYGFEWSLPEASLVDTPGLARFGYIDYIYPELEQMIYLLCDLRANFESWVEPFSLLKHRGSEPVLMPRPGVNGEIHATVRQNVAIRASSPNHLNAWNYVKLLLTESVQGRESAITNFWGIPVNKQSFRLQVADISDNARRTWVASERKFGAPALAAEDAEMFFEMHDNIARAMLPNSLLDGFFAEIMPPFFRDEISLDDAVGALERRMRMYISE